MPELLRTSPKLDRSKKSIQPKQLDPSLLRDILEGLVDIPMGVAGIGPDTKANRVGELIGAALPIGALGMALKGGGKVHDVVNASQAPFKTGAHTVHNIRKLSQTPAIESYKQFRKLGISHDEAVVAAGKGSNEMIANLDEVFKGGKVYPRLNARGKPQQSLTPTGKVRPYTLKREPHPYTPGSNPNKVNSPRGIGPSKDIIPSQTGRYDKANLKGSDFPDQNRLAMGMNSPKGIYDQSGKYLGAAPKIDEAYQAHVASSVGKFGKLKSSNMEEVFLDKGISGVSPSDAMIEELLKKYRNFKR